MVAVMGPGDDMEERFITAVRQQHLFAPDESVMVAISGGPDSVALLHLLLAGNRRAGWNLRLHLAHLEHGLRGVDSIADAAFVAELGAALGVPTSIERVDVATEAKARGLSIESAGRRCRLEFLERIALAQNATAIALGHHADDQAETVLHRIIRGTSIRGLGGMASTRAIRPGSTIRLVRPLLGFTRTRIERYLADNAFTFRTDATNQSQHYTRNRIRHLLLPMLREQFSPGADDAIRRLAAEARDAHRILERLSKRAFTRIAAVGPGEIRLGRDAFQRQPRAIQSRVLLQAITELGIGHGRLSNRHLRSLAAWTCGVDAGTLKLPPGLQVSRGPGAVTLRAEPAECQCNRTVPHGCEAMDLPIPGIAELPGTGWRITIEPPATFDPAGSLPSRQPYAGEDIREEWLDAEQVQLPLTLRTRQAGDRMRFLGSVGTGLLSDFFVDAKIDRAERERTPILCDARGPIWVVPWRIAHRVRITSQSCRILRVRAERTPTDCL